MPQHGTKRTFEGQKGQNEAIRDKRAEGAPLSPVLFPGSAWSLAWSTRVWLTENKSWLALVKLNYNYILFEILSS